MIRRHFDDEQQRNRRQSRRFSLLAVPAVLLAGIPLCIVASPIIFGVVVIAASAIEAVSPSDPERWEGLQRIATALPDIWNAVRGRGGDVPWGPLALLLVAPGMLVMLVAWPFVRHLSRVAGAGAILRLIPSREPAVASLAEQQFANAVEEMAVAGGVPVPAIRIIDSPASNIVAIGLTADDATILATTGFIGTLGRDERQAMIAHLVGSVRNGDLEIAAVILSVVETWALLTALLEAVIYPGSRALVRDFLAACRKVVLRTLDPAEARSVMDRLLGGARPDPMAVAEAFMPRNLAGVAYGLLVLIPLLATFGLASIAARHASSLFVVLGFGPWFAAAWRARRRLADATAVQLTRHPAALASAIRKLDGVDVEIPAGWPVYFLFPVWVPITAENAGRVHGGGEMVGMRLDAAARLETIATLSAGQVTASPPGWRARVRRALGTPREAATALLWGVVALVICALLLAGSFALTVWLLGLLWALPRALIPPVPHS